MATKEFKNRDLFTESGVFASDIPVDTEVKVSADRTFDKATATDVVVGHTVTGKLPDGRGTAEMYFTRRIKLVALAVLAAGGYWKRTWDAGTSSYKADTATATTAEGVVWVGGAIGANVELFQYK